MNKLLSISLVVLAMTACASKGKYMDAVQSWIGQDEAELVIANGAPSKVHEVSGRRFLSYQSDATTGSLRLTCTTTYEVVNGRVDAVRVNGNNCISM